MLRPTFLPGWTFLFFPFQVVKINPQSFIFRSLETQGHHTQCFRKHHRRTFCVRQLNYLLLLPGACWEVPRSHWVWNCFHSLPYAAEAMDHPAKWRTPPLEHPHRKLFQLLMRASLFYFCSGKELSGAWLSLLLQGLRGGVFCAAPICHPASWPSRAGLGGRGAVEKSGAQPAEEWFWLYF